MYSKEVKEYLKGQLKSIKDSGLYKEERIICSPQGARIKVKEGEVLNLCANNYLGLADDPELIAVAKKALDERGHGLSGSLYLWYPGYSQGVGKKDFRVFKDRGHAPLFFLCCRQRRLI